MKIFGLGSPERHFVINIICGLFYNKRTRLLLRKLLDSPVFEQIKFIKQDSGIRHPKLEFFTGYRGKSLVIGVNKKYVYKFPDSKSAENIAERELLITTTFSQISNIKIPIPEILHYKYGLVKKYDYVNGTSLCKMKDERINDITPLLAKQVAQFLFDISKENPKVLYKYKKNPKDKPGYMYGWCQGDLGDNLMIDKNNNILAIIDWEDAGFYDFSIIFNADKRLSVHNFMQQTKKHYDIMYNKANKDV